MIRLNNPVTIQRPAYTDQRTNQVVTPEPFQVQDLVVVFYDQESNSNLGAQIQGFPTNVTLYFGEDYKNLGDNRSLSGLKAKLLEILGDDPQKFLQNLFPATLESVPNGPGSILSGMISAMGIKSTPNCSCRRHAIEMNTNGPEWCEENMGTILNWLQEESTKRKLPFIRSVAKLMVQRAINRSRRLLAKEKANG
tara:strand:- start:440 stop:1024 length:585 start_codon:yes stop_codon:yes gene_type:complete